MSGAEASYFPNLLGPSLDRGRMLTPDWLPTGLGSAVGKDKMPTCRLHVTLPWGSHLRHLIVLLGTRLRNSSLPDTLETSPGSWPETQAPRHPLSHSPTSQHPAS